MDGNYVLHDCRDSAPEAVNYKASAADRFRGTLLGLAVSNALASAAARATNPNPRAASLEPVQWSEDTTMALCLARSLLESRGFNALDQTLRQARWCREFYLGSTGECASELAHTGIKTTATPACYSTTSASSAQDSSGCMTIKTLAPVPMYFASQPELALHDSGEYALQQGASLEGIDASRLLGLLLISALHGEDKEAVMAEVGPAVVSSPAVRDIMHSSYQGGPLTPGNNSDALIALELAVWCFRSAESFSEAVLKAFNLNDVRLR